MFFDICPGAVWGCPRTVGTASANASMASLGFKHVLRNLRHQIQFKISWENAENLKVSYLVTSCHIVSIETVSISSARMLGLDRRLRGSGINGLGMFRAVGNWCYRGRFGLDIGHGWSWSYRVMMWHARQALMLDLSLWKRRQPDKPGDLWCDVCNMYDDVERCDICDALV